MNHTILHNKQTGVALISVLLVFSLAVVIASEVVSRNYRDIRRTANVINSKQAYYYALGGEQFARQILHRDFIDSGAKKTDTLIDSWAQPLPPFDIEYGSMSIEIVDLQSRFNLNNLADNTGSAARTFRQLLNVLDIDTDYTAVLQDWVDADSAMLAGGAEDDSYRSRRTAYLAANREMTDRTELRLLDTMRPQDYNRLKNYVVALPVGTKYNLNTLDAKILQALSSQNNPIKATRINALQRSGGHETIPQWLSVNDAKYLAPFHTELDVQSEYFQVTVKVVYDERVSIIRTQLFRDKENGEIHVIKRQSGYE